MKIGVVANVLQDRPLEEALKTFREMNIEQIEPGCGGFAGKTHVDPERLLASPEALEEFKETLSKEGITISGIVLPRQSRPSQCRKGRGAPRGYV